MSRRPLPARLLLGGTLTGALVLLAGLSQVWTPEAPTRMRLALRLRPPFAAGLLGTDALGRDVASQLMAGAWNSLGIASSAVALGLLLGVGFGAVAAAAGGRPAEVVLRGADIVFAFPSLILALMLAALLGPGRTTAVLAIGIFNVPVFVRVTRGAAARVWARDFCRAAELAGQGRWRITWRHVLPNVAGLLAVQAAVQLGLAITVEAGLSFLGLGVAPPAPSWGRMLAEAQTYLGSAPWMALAPGGSILAAVLGLNLLGDGLRDLLDPRRGAR